MGSAITKHYTESRTTHVIRGTMGIQLERAAEEQQVCRFAFQSKLPLRVRGTSRMALEGKAGIVIETWKHRCMIFMKADKDSQVVTCIGLFCAICSVLEKEALCFFHWV